GDPSLMCPDIEQSFQEALAIYPPCGRRKIILSDEGKMYGTPRPSIAFTVRYMRKSIYTRAHTLFRLLVFPAQLSLPLSPSAQHTVDKALQSMATMSSAQIISPAAFQNKMALQGLSRPAYPTAGGTLHRSLHVLHSNCPPPHLPGYESTAGLSMSPGAPPWQGRCIASSKLRMLEFSAFLEQPQDPDTFNKHLFVHIGQSNPSYSDPYLESVDVRQIYDKFPEKKGGLKELFDKGPHNAFFLVKFWADLSVNLQDDSSFFYGVSSQYESSESMIITSSTKVCSFGKQVVEKVETEYARFENGRYMFRIHRSPLCEYMINFIHKLKHLPEKYMMNSVLENFTILQVVSNRDTLETLLCVAYVFEVSTSEHGAQHHIYRLVKD
uniref:TEA domain transcription factor 4 n=1 Tax=Hippocampus comes TaxID=109280 RepID=A0A3Q2XGC0_HIPCM